MSADNSFEVKNIEIWAPAFFKHNNSFVATVIPYAVKDITIGKDSDVNIVYKYGMEVSLFFITEKGVWHPNFISICQC